MRVSGRCASGSLGTTGTLTVMEQQQFDCGSQQQLQHQRCIPLQRFHDGIVDCPDGSDECLLITIQLGAHSNVTRKNPSSGTSGSQSLGWLCIFPTTVCSKSATLWKYSETSSCSIFPISWLHYKLTENKFTKCDKRSNKSYECDLKFFCYILFHYVSLRYSTRKRGTLFDLDVFKRGEKGLSSVTRVIA